MTVVHTITQTSIDGLNIASEVVGDGRPVLLLHGWGGRIESMQQVAERLAPLGYNVHILDLPGFGRSTLPAEAWGVADYAQFVAHYLDHVKLDRVNVIGHSFGGRVSLILGADHPQYVSKIVLTDSAGVMTPPTTNQRLRQVAFNAANAILGLPGLSALQQRFRLWVRNRFGSEDLRNAGPLEAIFRKVIVEDLLPYAARLKAPTLLIWGEQDQDTPLWQGQLLEKTIPDAGLVVFKGAGHFAYQEQIADFIRIVDTFFGGKR
ncbi:MAG: alpha/beta hydrolase [Chloroflexota bacterium]